MTRRKTLEELIVDLNQLRLSYQQQNLEINQLKNSYNECKSAKMFLRRNKNLQNNDPRILINQQRTEQNHVYYKETKITIQTNTKSKYRSYIAEVVLEV